MKRLEKEATADEFCQPHFIKLQSVVTDTRLKFKGPQREAGKRCELICPAEHCAAQELEGPGTMEGRMYVWG